MSFWFVSHQDLSVDFYIAEEIACRSSASTSPPSVRTRRSPTCRQWHARRPARSVPAIAVADGRAAMPLRRGCGVCSPLKLTPDGQRRRRPSASDLAGRQLCQRRGVDRPDLSHNLLRHYLPRDVFEGSRFCRARRLVRVAHHRRSGSSYAPSTPH